MVERPGDPASRSGLKEALSRMEISQPQLLLEKCLGLSLSDQYWICPEESKLRWEEVNFSRIRFPGMWERFCLEEMWILLRSV